MLSDTPTTWRSASVLSETASGRRNSQAIANSALWSRRLAAPKHRECGPLAPQPGCPLTHQSDLSKNDLGRRVLVVGHFVTGDPFTVFLMLREAIRVASQNSKTELSPILSSQAIANSRDPKDKWPRLRLNPLLDFNSTPPNFQGDVIS